MTTSSDPTSKPRRKRGAPPGNTNALNHGAPPGNYNAVKHGFYSTAFARSDKDRLEHDVQGELTDEEECLRYLAYRVVLSMGGEKMDHDRYVLALRTVCLAFGRIESIHRSRKVIYDKQTTFDKVLEELKYIPLEED
jgi:hypothetical protein